MSYTRISSDGSQPQKNWAQLAVTTSGSVSTAAAFALVRTPAERALVIAPITNTDTVTIGPTNTATHRSLAPGDEYTIQAPPGVVFDLALWFSISPTASQALSIIYI